MQGIDPKLSFPTTPQIQQSSMLCTEVPNLENEAPQNRPSTPTAQLGNARELKFCMNSHLVNTNNNAEAIFDTLPQSRATGGVSSHPRG